MRKTIFLFLLLLGTSGLFAQDISLINGTWNLKTPRTIKLFKVENGSLTEMASSVLTDDNKFAFAFFPKKENFYVIGLNASVPTYSYSFYFKPGDRLNVVMEGENGYTLVGENTPENKEMAKWHDFVLPLESQSLYSLGKNITYVDFFPVLEEKLKGLNTYQQDYTGNQVFNEAFKYFREFNMEYLAMNFLSLPRSAHPKGADFPDYYRQLTLENMTATDKLLDYPLGINLISLYMKIQMSYMPEKYKELLGDKKNFAPVMLLPQIVNDRIKGEVTLIQARGLKSYDALLEFESEYGKYLVTPSLKKRFKDISTRAADNASGQTAIDFKFADRTGKEIALSDFKGKVVYIDLWATWCGPCRKEFPHLKKLEAEYHGNENIVFIGVSTDKSEDKQKWLNFLEKEQLPGIQLFAGDAANEAVMRPYKVQSIPRFILVGKDGRLIFADAPRPSSDEIKIVLDSALKK